MEDQRGSAAVKEAPRKCKHAVIVSLGAGDAFFGGVVAYMYANASAPTSQRELEYMGRVSTGCHCSGPAL
jgi:sugar/nucleoside kinase (ribokinase family)